MTKRIQLLEGPDASGKSLYLETWDDTQPPYCSHCGGCVSIGRRGITCVGRPGATPAQPGCGAVNAPSMPRGQVHRRQEDISAA